MDITDIKADNVKKILDTLRASSSLTKRDIAAVTGLSFSTVSNLCNELKDKQVLYEEKSSEFAVGRTPNRLVFRNEQYFSFCIDLQQEESFSFSVLNFSNQCLYHTTVDISRCKDVHQIVDVIVEICQAALQLEQLQNIPVIELGIAVPGIYDPQKEQIVSTVCAQLNHTELKRLIMEKMTLPCHIYIDNQSNFCALSMCQASAPSANILYLHSAACLGLGVICNGTILRGNNGLAGEIRHIPLGDPSIRCPACGQYGCIENELASRGMDMLDDECLSPGEREIIIVHKGSKLGELLGILINLFDPSILYVGGSAMSHFQELLPHILAYLEKACPMAMAQNLQIVYDNNSHQTVNEGITQTIYEKWNPLENF